MESKYDLIQVLESIDPAMLSYQEWCSVGIALKDANYTAADWDAWSARDDKRYHPGECFKKWDTFRGSGKPVTAGTIVQFARDQGWQPPDQGDEPGQELGWNATISANWLCFAV